MLAIDIFSSHMPKKKRIFSEYENLLSDNKCKCCAHQMEERNGKTAPTPRDLHKLMLVFSRKCISLLSFCEPPLTEINTNAAALCSLDFHFISCQIDSAL
ncbi:hypothetical protein T4A_12191 [Trichinella pseudospiralis]|uniref:Uncharacterized protein n=1 Tax=Trichinella pseudospiralis TaxID=6337 RepID=A0A0V1JJS5_TRIPS|nr:hypothetical protein T4A_12191 [Trichinella pseudospiralis]KRZ35233.1 hypothetical protein T4C_4714 [Trichinella pseudospiralis]